MEITIENCNCIDSAKISIELDRLNIKYGPNGTGKSTIAKAIELTSKGDSGLSVLMPFKHRASVVESSPNPRVQGANSFKNVVVFNEAYVEQYVFKKEVIDNSFEIFIRNAEYEKKMAEIEDLISDIKDIFKENDSIDQVIKDLNDLSESFGKSQSGFSKAGRISKAIGKGNKVEHIPEKLAPYANFIRSEKNVNWIGWHIKGNDFLGISQECPYCTAPTDEKKERILAVSAEYDAKSIEHLNILQGIIDRLGNYFSKDFRVKIDAILKNKTELKKEEISYLTVIKQQIDTLREKLQDIKGISFFSLRDVGKLQERVKALIIDITYLEALDSSETRTIIDEVNGSLTTLLSKAGRLQGEVAKQKYSIESTIKKYKSEVNDFLKYAGYRYIVDFQSESESYIMKLKHLDFEDNIEDGKMHLSFGEKNAFAIVLFMYECLTKNPDLIVLDDPISSFDKSKKFAILEMLFRGKNSFRDKTVLMLTHDIEPVIDMIKIFGGRHFQPMPVASFLKYRTGTICEVEINKSDILSFAQICDENINACDSDIIKSIYLRRHYEVVDDKGVEYQLLSSLFHKEAIPRTRENDIERPMRQDEIDSASTSIQEKLTSFDYSKLIREVQEDSVMINTYHKAQNGYEKLQIFRIINNDNHENSIVRKYINESFHIENEYIMQLNPHKYDFVPDHIIAECDEMIICGFNF